MSERPMRVTGFSLTVAVIIGAVALLNIGIVPANVAAAKCKAGGGGGGGQSPSSTPSSTPTGGGGGLPITLPPGGGGGSTTPQPTGSPTAEQSRQTCPTKVTIDYKRSDASSSTTEFFGALKSPKAACERGRAVLLKKDSKSGTDKTVGSTVSKKSGKWRIREPRARGKYYALAKKERRPGTICSKGRSKSIEV